MEQIASPFSINKYALSHDRSFDNSKLYKKIAKTNWEQLYRLQQAENEQYKLLLNDYSWRLEDSSKINSLKGASESQLRQMI